MEDHKSAQSGEQHETSSYKPPATRLIQMKPFSFVMLIFGLVLATAAVTFFALTTGDDKVVEVVNPQNTAANKYKVFEKLFNAYDEVRASYIDEIDEEKMVDGAINGMIDALGDPFSDYLNEQETAKLNESISSSFEGIGAEIQESNGYIQIVAPVKNSPAERAGLLPNDIILAVDGTDIQGMSSSEAVLLIRGEKGTTVTLSIRRGDQTEPFDVKVTRDVIPRETVYTEIVADNLAHIQITSFSDNTYQELKNALARFEKDGIKGIILDVRQNPGGTLQSASDISDLFVEEGEPIFQFEAKDGTKEIIVASNEKKVNVPVAVVIDDGSASASEILAGALKESSKIPLIGLTTFGKGTVQTPKNLADGSNLKLTTAKWLTPKGNWIHNKGITPDYEVPYPDYATLPYIDPSEEFKEGMVSPLIRSAEEMLNVLGYEPGTVDGLYDQHTVQAVKKLQTEHSLQVTGVLTGETTLQLMTKLRQKIQEDDPQLKKAIEILKQKVNS